MKAKVIATGEIVDVFHAEQHGCPELIFQEATFVNCRRWTEDQLDFDVSNCPQWHDASKELPDRPFEGWRYSDVMIIAVGVGLILWKLLTGCFFQNCRSNLM